MYSYASVYGAVQIGRANNNFTVSEENVSFLSASGHVQTLYVQNSVTFLFIFCL